jgi:ribonuclease BN (tRNA processing enzyme)
MPERRVGRVDAVLFTHHHNDHINGLDDLRRFNEMYDAAIPCLGPDKRWTKSGKKFRYIFIRTQTEGENRKSRLRPWTNLRAAVDKKSSPCPCITAT